MRRAVLFAFVVLAFGVAGFLWLTQPERFVKSDLPEHKPDLENGALLFFAGGCASCHAAPASAKCDDPDSRDKSVLRGGRCLKTPFGIFSVPNISPDEETGIGKWSELDFVNAMVKGVSPNGAHYYPAFPYTSYQRMTLPDLLDLKAYIDGLPAVSHRAPPHDLLLPFRLRRGLGLWKLLYLDGNRFSPDPSKTAAENRGGYLVEGPGHCGECHSPRDVFGGIDRSRAYAGGPSPEGRGSIPNITPHQTGLGDWSAQDIADVLESGLTPSFDSLGGSMVAVQENIAKLPASDRAAIAAYLKALRPVESTPKKK